MLRIIASLTLIFLVASIVMLTPTLVPKASGIICPPGFYADVGTFDCIPCPPNTFQPNFDAFGVDACIACPAGTTSLAASVSQNDCEPIIVDGSVPEFGLEAVIMIAILAPVMLLLVRRAKAQS